MFDRSRASCCFTRAFDTHYLIPLRDLLKAELELKGLWQLAQEDFQMACNPNA